MDVIEKEPEDLGSKEDNKKPYGKLDITDDLLKKITALAERGMSRAHVRDYLVISKRQWMKKSVHTQELEKAYLRGQAQGVAFTAGKLMELIKMGNLEAIKFYLARIAKYSEAPESDTNEPEIKKAEKLIIATLDPIEAAKIYQEFMKGSIK